jgi:CheY-like chemotaxis protein
MPSAAKASPQSRNKKVILCIDDYKQGLHGLRLILETAGYNVLTASSGRIGLRFLERHPVQLVILDYRMPGRDGEAVAREVRRTHPRTPILMLSGQIDVPKRASSAVDAFIAKGEPPTVLLQHLAVLSDGGRGGALRARLQVFCSRSRHDVATSHTLADNLTVLRISSVTWRQDSSDERASSSPRAPSAAPAGTGIAASRGSTVRRRTRLWKPKRSTISCMDLHLPDCTAWTLALSRETM